LIIALEIAADSRRASDNIVSTVAGPGFNPNKSER
jgi:hypothetical protein